VPLTIIARPIARRDKPTIGTAGVPPYVMAKTAAAESPKRGFQILSIPQMRTIHPSKINNIFAIFIFASILA